MEMSSMYPNTAQGARDLSNKGLVDAICMSYFDSYYDVPEATHTLSLCKAEFLRRLDETEKDEPVSEAEDKT